MRANSYSGVIMDPVHGSIQLFDHERKIIDHPLFQRLRFINQNDVLSLVFPGATHTRFAHSIGAMHVSQKIWDGILNQNVRYRQIKKIPTRAAEDALIYLNKCVRMAILMHDCGHGAFSHQLENTPGIQKILAEGRLFTVLWKDADFSKYYSKVPTEICHEHYSVRAAQKILTDVICEEDQICIEDVLSIMETTDTNVSARFNDACVKASIYFMGLRDWVDSKTNVVEPMLNLLRCFISCEFDADKGDYMLRDSMFSGGDYGHYNLDSILHNFSTSEEGHWFGLVLNRKGLGALEDFVLSRYQMYRQIYNHKTANGFELLIQMAIDEILESRETLEYVEQCLSSIDDFADLVDGYFWGEFRRYAKMNKNSACSAILNRRPMKFLLAIESVCNGKESPSTSSLINEKRKEQAEALGVPVEQIVYSTNNIRFSKINDKYITIKVRDVHPISGEVRLRKISDMSPFFSRFENIDVTHLYHCPWISSRSGNSQ
ncbi:HD domain-containing protein [Pseudomonas luteola]